MCNLYYFLVLFDRCMATGVENIKCLSPAKQVVPNYAINLCNATFGTTQRTGFLNDATLT